MTDALPSPVGLAAPLANRRTQRLDQVFRLEELESLRLLARIRTAAMILLGVWLVVDWPSPHLAENLISAGLFAVLGWCYYWLTAWKRGRPWHFLIFPVIDALITIDNLLPVMPWNATVLPEPVLLRYTTITFLFVPLAFAAFLYTPWRTLWSAVAIALCWGGGCLWVLTRPGAFFVHRLWLRQDVDPVAFLSVYLDPNYVDLDGIANMIFVVLLVGGLLTVLVWRTRELVHRQMAAERARAQLARYFSPNMIDALETADQPLGDVTIQEVGVLFADIVGFTRLSEAVGPERLMTLLRSFHRRMADIVFTHDGTLDKYIGDAVMATFGTPRPGRLDAVNALRCARAMIDELDRWNRKRLARGATPIRVGIGVHYGLAVLGDIGDERRLEFAVIGDTVNVASRLERLTRGIGATILASQELIDAARRQSPELTEAALEGFAVDKPRKLRGRQEPVSLWAYRPAAASADANAA